MVHDSRNSPLSNYVGDGMSGKNQTLFFNNRPRIISGMSVVGKREGEGPLGKYFDEVVQDAKCGEKTFEKGEKKMFHKAIFGAIGKAGLSAQDIEVFLAGDLLNQLVSSSYVARELPVSYLGMYSACSTMTECLTLGATLIDDGRFHKIACATGSHFATAERQYRYPLEYGCQRPPYAQWTATASGCSILSSDGDGPAITHATIGRVVDYGINDLNNMGAAMAPAALDTLLAVTSDTGYEVSDFDAIFTGDLGRLGAEILRDLCREQGIELGQKYSDCGEMLFTRDQHCYCGGSGAGCSASVLNSFILRKMGTGEYNRVLLLATGALMSPTTSYQGETIPCISHGVILENVL